jgi:hypothetical protein
MKIYEGVELWLQFLDLDTRLRRVVRLTLLPLYLQGKEHHVFIRYVAGWAPE